MKKALMILVAMASVSSWGQNISVSKSQDATAEDLPLTYSAERTEVERTGVLLMGTVKNTGKIPYRYVKVTFTVKKSSGGFITRDVAYTDPTDIGPGQVGYIDKWIDTGGEVPGKIEWSITGRQ